MSQKVFNRKNETEIKISNCRFSEKQPQRPVSFFLTTIFLQLKAKGHIQGFLECGLSDADNLAFFSTYPNNGFNLDSLDKQKMVERRRFKLLTSSLPAKRSIS